MRRVAFLLIPLFLFACDRAPVAPAPDEAGTPSLAATHDAWVWQFDGSGLGAPWVECRGENLQWSGLVDLHYRSTTTPSGNEVWHWKLDYATDTPFGALGLVSGDVWTLLGGVDVGGSVTKPKGTQLVDHWQAKERYVNQDGEQLHVQVDYRMMIDADGDVKFDRYRETYKCPGKP